MEFVLSIVLSQYLRRRNWTRKQFGRDAAILRLMLRNTFSRKSVVGAPEGPVVSLTSYGARVASVYLTIESIARNDLRPARLILWIDDVQQFNRLPKRLQRLMDRGLEVLLCEDLGPHKKYYPYLMSQTEFTAPLVTADDDVMYPENWLGSLNAAYEKNDGVVSCFRARTVAFDGRSGLAAYHTWPMCNSIDPSPLTFSTGVSGALYPPLLLGHLKLAGRGFTELCPKADDVWLHVNALRAGFKVQQIVRRGPVFPHIPGSQEVALYQFNKNEGGNDRQIRLTYRAADISFLAAAANKTSAA